MTFWEEVLAVFIGDVFASVLLIVSYAVIQWSLRATDITVSYNWGYQGTNFRPNVDIRNRSGSRTYGLANIAYRKNNGKDVVFFDNQSVWGTRLEPGSITYLDTVRPIPNIGPMADCLNLGVTVYLQNGRQFWLKGQGPGQLTMGRIQRIAFWLRQKFERAAIPLE